MAKSGKFDCTVMSLSVLLDYRPEDTKVLFLFYTIIAYFVTYNYILIFYIQEHSFEVSLFAELFNEMLMRDFGFRIYRSLSNLPEKTKEKDEEKKKEKRDDKKDDKRKEDEKKSSKKDEKRDDKKREESKDKRDDKDSRNKADEKDREKNEDEDEDEEDESDVRTYYSYHFILILYKDISCV